MESIGRGKEAPKLPSRLQPLWQAFMALHSQRQHTEAGPQPLLFQEVLAFLSLEGLWVPESQVPGFTRAIRALDSEYLDMVNKRQEAKRRARGE